MNLKDKKEENNIEYNNLIDKIIYNIFGDKFKLTKDDYKIFDNVRTHKSISENNYEIYETLGDGILKGIIIQSIIESCNTILNESYISELRMLLERTEIFSYLLTKYFGEIEDHIHFIKSNNPYDYEKIKEDIFEALIGAIYNIIYNHIHTTKSDYNLLYQLIKYYKIIFKKYIQKLQENKEQLLVNHVKQLSEYCMKYHKNQPIYKYKKINTSKGVIYEMTITLDDQIIKCQEKTQKQAKQQCAYLMLSNLNIIQTKKINKNIDINNVMWEE